MQSFLYSFSGTNQPSQLTGAAQFTQARFMPFKGFTASGSPIQNSNVSYIGSKSGECSLLLSTGIPVVVDLASSQSFYDNFNNWWAVGTSGDGVYVSYI